MNQTVTIHMGTHKTASSLLQKALRNEAKTISEQIGLFGRKINDLHSLPIFKTAFENSKSPIADFSGTGDALVTEIAARGVDPDGPILISDEDIMGPHRMDRGKRAYFRTLPISTALQEVFGDRLRFVVYLRDPMGFFVSTYVQRIQSGHVVNWEAYKKYFSARRLSWISVIDDLHAVVGPENVHIVLYDEIKSGALEYCNQVFHYAPEGVGLSGRTLASGSVNRALPERGLQAAAAAYPFLEHEERRKLKLFLQDMLKDDKTKYFPITRQEAEKFLSRAEEDIRRLSEVVTPERKPIVESWLDLSRYDVVDEAA